MYSWDRDNPLNTQKINSNCKRNGFDNIEYGITEEQCENCPHFKSKFIEYPITVTEIDNKPDDGYRMYQNKIGKLAKVRPCGEEYGGKTYLGIFLGDIPHSPHISHNPDTGVLTIRPYCNPAIFVPELKKIIFGLESWWSIVETEKDLDKEITDELINNQWYVQMAKLLSGKDR
jgi:hypothetical protein